MSSSINGRLGISQPFLLLSGIIHGLFCTMGIDTSLGPSTSHQIIFGVGVGVAISVLMIVTTALSSNEDHAICLSTVTLLVNIDSF